MHLRNCGALQATLILICILDLCVCDSYINKSVNWVTAFSWIEVKLYNMWSVLFVKIHLSELKYFLFCHYLGWKANFNLHILQYITILIVTRTLIAECDLHLYSYYLPLSILSDQVLRVLNIFT
jgi:hypothetical protein